MLSVALATLVLNSLEINKRAFTQSRRTFFIGDRGRSYKFKTFRVYECNCVLVHLFFSFHSSFVFIMSSSVKIRFTLRAEPSPTDKKTTVIHMHTMQFLDESAVYEFPSEYRALSHHEVLMRLPVAVLAKKDLAPRWKARPFKVTLPAEIAKLYIDADGNPVFLGKMLDVLDNASVSSETSSVLSFSESDEPVRNFILNSVPAKKPLSSIIKEAVVPKFGSKTVSSNADAWLDVFESECRRLGIEQEHYWEVIRLFLEDSAEKWYTTTRLSSLSTSWDFWRNSFVENFGRVGLATARSAFTYYYVGGSLSDYVQNKLNRLVSFNPKMHELDKMAHLALGLPSELQERINFADVTTLSKLLAIINSFDRVHVVRTGRSDANNSYSQSNAFSSLRPKLPPCAYCKKNKGREFFHSEKDCYSKVKDSQRRSSGQYNVKKAVNNLNLEDLRSEVDEHQKNE